MGHWYLAFNPALERTWHGPDVKQGLGFAPAFKVGYDLTPKVNAGVEYYADYGRLWAFDGSVVALLAVDTSHASSY